MALEYEGYDWLMRWYFDQYTHKKVCPAAVFNSITELCYILLFHPWYRHPDKIDWT